MTMSPEETLLVCCARTKMRESDIRRVRELNDRNLDWYHIARIATQNRVGPLLYRNLKDIGQAASVPSQAMDSLKQSYHLTFARNNRFEQETREVLTNLRETGLKVIIMRGLVLAEIIFGDTALRPFTDIDLLIRKEDLPQIKLKLADLGYTLPSDALADGYYERNHLHLLLVKRPNGVAAEVHWAIDHKYTLYDIDYPHIFEDAQRGKIAGTEALLLSPEDRLLCLCAHLVKHCYYNKFILNQPDFLSLVLASGSLVQYCDIAETVRHHSGEMDWDAIREKAEGWGMEGVVHTGLFSTARLFDPPVPEGFLENLSPARINYLERKVFPLVINGLRGQKGTSHIEHSLRKKLGIPSGLVFRPIRMLDLFGYFFPDPQFISRRYAVSQPAVIPLCYGFHICKALWQVLMNVIDLIYYSFQKRLARTSKRI